jgi:hypothetical protein
MLEIAGRRGLFALRRLSFEKWLTKAPEVACARLASLMPGKVNLSLRDIRIGCYEPSGPLNGWSRRLGLPFGCLTIHKLAFARAFLLGGR